MPGSVGSIFQGRRVAAIDDLGLDDAARALPFIGKGLGQALGQRGVGGNDGGTEQSGRRGTLCALAGLGFRRQAEEEQVIVPCAFDHVQRQGGHGKIGVGRQRSYAVAGERPSHGNCAGANCLTIQRNDFGAFVAKGIDAHRQALRRLAGGGEETLLHRIGRLGKAGRLQGQQQRNVRNDGLCRRNGRNRHASRGSDGRHLGLLRRGRGNRRLGHGRGRRNFGCRSRFSGAAKYADV